MAHGNTRFGDDDKARAKRLYVEQGKSAHEVAEDIGCSSRTVQIWIRDLDWAPARAAWVELQGVPVEALEERALRRILARLEKDADTLPSKELLDLLGNVNKFRALLAKRQGYRLLDAALVVGEEFQAFVLRECPDEAPRLLNAWREFLEDVQRRGM
jgi:transposase-like protein